MSGYSDGYWWSPDGLRLHYRDYGGGADGRPPLLCLPGLTRNARDFEPLAARLAGALLNDVGPALDEAGLARIRTYVGVNQSHPSWVHAARALEEGNRDVYPTYGLEQWLAMAKRLYRLNSAGRIVLDYDMRIAEPIRAMGSEAGVDMWPVMAAFRDIPTLLLRGERSDLLSAETAQRMVADIGAKAELVTVPGVGHAPALDEPESIAAIDRLLARVLHG